MDFTIKDKYTLYDLVALLDFLRGEGGCPWDRVQTHESLRRNLLEEAYEAAEAIDEKDPVHLREELGDVLLQVLFHAAIESDAGRFDLEDVADAECKKLVSRHVHVFGSAEARTAEEVPDLWDEIKRAERSQETVFETMEGVSKTLPGLWRAEKIQKKAAAAGFDTTDPGAALDKLEEKTQALRRAASGPDAAAAFRALGDVLLAAVGAGRLLGADPEDAVSDACKRFIAEVRQAEGRTASADKPC